MNAGVKTLIAILVSLFLIIAQIILIIPFKLYFISVLLNIPSMIIIQILFTRIISKLEDVLNYKIKRDLTFIKQFFHICNMSILSAYPLFEYSIIINHCYDEKIIGIIIGSLIMHLFVIILMIHFDQFDFLDWF